MLFLFAVAALFAYGFGWVATAASVLTTIGAVRALRRWGTVGLVVLALACARYELVFYQQARAVSAMQAQQQPFRAYVTAAYSKDVGVNRVTLRTPAGNTQADLKGYLGFAPGDIIEITCEWSVPEAFDGFRYDYYLASKGIHALCEPKRWSRQGTVSFWRHPLLISRAWVLASIAALWPAPARSLIAGLLIGNRESFSQAQLDHFSRAGITHIIALSGTNISILIAFFEAVALRMRVKSGPRVFLVLGAITWFVLLVGAPSSVVRAAVMGSIAYVATYFGRPTNALRLLLSCAALMVLVNPAMLLYDVSFQLSFVSTAGVIWLLPVFERLVRRLPATVAETLAMTLAATTATAPLLLYQFGSISMAAPLTNIVILPLIPHIMAASAVAVLMSVAHVPLTSLVVIVTKLACQYVFAVAAFASGWTWILLTWQMTFFSLAGSYIILIGVMIYAARSKKTS